MNKQELIKRYNYFLKKEKLTNEQAWVGSGGTLLLLDLRSSTQDIDLGVPKDIFDNIRTRGLPEHIFNGDTIVIEYDDVIDLHIDHGHEEHTIIEGVGSWTPEEVLRLKERLNRHKDQEDIKKIKKYLIKNPLTKLTQSRTPEQLLTWMSKNLTYEGKYKGYLRNPEQVVKDKKGHCWETSELANRELTALGYVCQTLYLVNNDLYDQDTVTHSTIIIKDKLSKYFWFEWSWYKQEGIHGPFKNLNETINFVISCFKKQYATISTVKISGVGLMHLTTETEYINSVNKWSDVVLEPFKNIIYKW